MDSAPPHPPLLPPPDFTLVEIHNLSLPSPASSFNNLRVCLRPDSNFASLSTSLHPSLELTRGSDTPFKLSSADLILKPKKSRKKNKASSTPPAPVPPSPAYTELVVATDVIGGDGTDWETYGTNETALEAIAVQRKEGTKSTHHLKMRRVRPASEARGNESDTQVIPLSYAPLVLHLTYLPRAFVSTLTLLVSSSDSNIRIYQPVLNNNGLFEEVTDQGVREKLLPNLHQVFPSPILTIDTLLTSPSTYHVACGCRCGYLCSTSYDPNLASSGSSLALLVSSLSGYLCVFNRPLPDPNWSPSFVFPESVDPTDPVLSVCSSPFPTLSGTAVFAGTGKGKILVFEGPRFVRYSPGPPPPHILSSTFHLPSPVQRIAVGDVDGDGIPEVLAVTRNCVSVFRRRIEEVKVMGEFKIKLMERRK